MPPIFRQGAAVLVKNLSVILCSIFDTKAVITLYRFPHTRFLYYKPYFHYKCFCLVFLTILLKQVRDRVPEKSKSRVLEVSGEIKNVFKINWTRLLVFN